MKQKIVIAGGTGFMGQYLNKRFTEDDYEVIVVGRGKGCVSWDDKAEMIAALESSTMLINLAGKAIKGKFTENNKKELIDSRVSTTQKLGNAVQQCQYPPALWFNASGAHIYGTDDQRPHTESDIADKHFFLATMAKEWEDAFFAFNLKRTRQIALRISIVLGKDGGVLQPFIQLTRFGLGGNQGDGQQKFSWIHIEDCYQIIRFAAENSSVRGAINLCTPNPVNNEILMKTLRKIMNMPIGIPSPAFAIKIGAAIMGIESDLILKSLWVMPERLVESGYSFKYPKLEAALENIIK